MSRLTTLEKLTVPLTIGRTRVDVAAPYRDGIGIPLVFLHGFGSTKEDYADVVRQEHLADRPVLAYDAPDAVPRRARPRGSPSHAGKSGSTRPSVTPAAGDLHELPNRELGIGSQAAQALRSATMRHVRTLIAALVVAPLAWIALAYGQDRAAQAITDAGAENAVQAGDVVRALVVLTAAGLLLGLIASLRVSPVGAVVTGAAYLASYAGLLIVPEPMLEVFTRTLSVAGYRADLSIPLQTGTAALLGAMLLVAVVSVGRWRRWPRPSEPVDTSAFDAQGALGAHGFSADVPFAGTGSSYALLSPGPSHPGARASDPSWPDSLRNSDPR